MYPSFSALASLKSAVAKIPGRLYATAEARNSITSRSKDAREGTKEEEDDREKISDQEEAGVSTTPSRVRAVMNRSVRQECGVVHQAEVSIGLRTTQPNLRSPPRTFRRWVSGPTR